MAYDHDVIQNASELKKDDIVIAIMGPTGSGKSNILDKLIGGDTKRAESNLQSQSSDVLAVRIKNHSIYKNRIVILETPGFDQMTKSDLEILQMISQWLLEVHKRMIRVQGIVYLHRITDNRMSGSPNRNLRIMGDLCGDKGAAGVCLVTTMWDMLRQPILGQEREADLKTNFWNDLLANGASTSRFDNTAESAWAIIDKVATKDTSGVLLLLQEEMALLGRKLEETRVGRAFASNLQHLQSMQKKQLDILKALSVSSTPSMPPDELEARIVSIENQINATANTIEKLHLSLGRRMKLLFQKGPTGRVLVIKRQD